MTRRPAYWLLSWLFLFTACQDSRPKVVVYCALDQVFSEPILKDFEKATGIRMEAVYDIEANKTVGLVRTLEEEKSNPRCDVFWNNELAQTIKLKQAGILQAYHSPAAKDIPQGFRDREGYWHGFAARARIFIVNTQKLEKNNWPQSLQDLVDPQYKGIAALAKPLTGTTMTHFAALFTVWGEEQTKEFCQKILQNQVNLSPGNAYVSKLVANGELAFGLTDTDDFHVRQEEGAPVAAVYPDQDGIGTLLIPNSLALIQGAPHAENGKKLIDWLLQPEIEERLAFGRSAQIPLRPNSKHPETMSVPGDFRLMQVNWESVAAEIKNKADYLRETFAK